MSAVQVDKIVETYTCVSAVVDYTTDSDINFEAKNICLQQEPNEMFSLKLLVLATTCSRCHKSRFPNDSSYTRNCCRCTITKISFELSLHFQNVLHYLSHSYSYKVLCKLHAVNDATVDETVLFSGQQLRKMQSIVFQGSICDENYFATKKEIAVCFFVNRFNDKSTVISENRGLLSSKLFNESIANENFGDVTIKVQDEVFHVCENVLSSKSQVFQAMFAHQMSETRNRQIDISDFDSNVIKEMLMYLYTNETENIQQMAIELYKAAHKYEISNLKHECLEYIIFYNDPENLVSILDLAITYDLIDLENGIREYIKSRENDFVGREDYQKLLQSHLTIDKVAWTLQLCEKYTELLSTVKCYVFEFIKQNVMQLSKKQEYLGLFESHPKLMREIFVFLNP